MKRNYRKWTPEEDAALRQMVADNVLSDTIGERLGRDSASVFNRLKRLGVRYPRDHYKRRGLAQRTPIAERLLSNISPEPNSGCWLWTGTIHSSGYGFFSVPMGGQSKNVKAHRAVYEHFKGPIPYGLQLDHLCRVRCCVNPDHLEPVTSAENTRRGNAGMALVKWIKAGNHWTRPNGN